MDSLIESKNCNLEKMCCLCLMKKQPMNLLSEGGVADMLSQCTSIRISINEDVYLVCDCCTEEINRWYAFKKQIEVNFEIGRLPLLEDSQNLAVDFEKSNLCLDNELVHIENCNLNSESDSTTSELLLDEKCHVCGVCKNTFSSEDQLKMHMRIHDGEKIFNCTHCHETFAAEYQLKFHIKYVHKESEKSIICEICKKSIPAKFSVEHYLLSHKGSSIRKEHNYMCQICGKKFLAKAPFQFHKRHSHANERPLN